MLMTNDSVSKRKINYRFDLKVCRLHLKIADSVATFQVTNHFLDNYVPIPSRDILTVSAKTLLLF